MLRKSFEFGWAKSGSAGSLAELSRASRTNVNAVEVDWLGVGEQTIFDEAVRICSWTSSFRVDFRPSRALMVSETAA